MEEREEGNDFILFQLKHVKKKKKPPQPVKSVVSMCFRCFGKSHENSFSEKVSDLCKEQFHKVVM